MAGRATAAGHCGPCAGPAATTRERTAGPFGGGSPFPVTHRTKGSLPHPAGVSSCHMGADTGIPVNESSVGGRWRVRIRGMTGGLTGEILGAGILLDGDTVLTCAHVIPDDGRPVPASQVL